MWLDPYSYYSRPGPIRRFFRFFGRVVIYAFVFISLLNIVSRLIGRSDRREV